MSGLRRPARGEDPGPDTEEAEKAWIRVCRTRWDMRASKAGVVCKALRHKEAFVLARRELDSWTWEDRQGKSKRQVRRTVLKVFCGQAATLARDVLGLPPHKQEAIKAAFEKLEAEWTKKSEDSRHIPCPDGSILRANKRNIWMQSQRM